MLRCKAIAEMKPMLPHRNTPLNNALPKGYVTNINDDTKFEKSFQDSS